VRKMTVIKGFTPLPTETGDELYPNGVFVFNISKLLQNIANNQDIFHVEQVMVNLLPLLSSSNLNEATIKSADLSVPILMAEISPNQFNVIDGHHRLEKARRDDVNIVPAYKIPAEHHIRFLNSTDAYLAYVEYWNAKLE